MQIILTTQYSPWSAYFGGGQCSTHNLAKTFVKSGHDVTVIFTKAPWEKINVPDDIPYKFKWGNLYNTGSRRNDVLRPLSAFSVVSVADELISDNENTIIHSNGEEGGRLHTLLDKHTFGLISTPRYPSFPEKLKFYEGMNIPQKAAFLLGEGKYVMLAKTIRHAHFCSPPSHWAASEVQSIFGLSAEKMHPVPNGVSANFLACRRSKSARTGPILFFGRLEHDKGVDTLIKALAKFKKDRLPNIHIIGRGNLESRLKKLTMKLSISDKIIFKNWMSQSELCKELANARMAILPSRNKSFGNTIAEAAATGTPVISTTACSIPEIIEDGKNGLLVPPSDSRKLKEAIEFFLDHPEKREEMGQKGTEHVRNNLTWGDTCRKFEQLYDKALHLQKCI